MIAYASNGEASPRGRAVGDGPFLDAAVFPDGVEAALAGKSGAIDYYLDLFLRRAYDVELESRFAAAPAPTKMVKGGR